MRHARSLHLESSQVPVSRCDRPLHASGNVTRMDSEMIVRIEDLGAGWLLQDSIDRILELMVEAFEVVFKQ